FTPARLAGVPWTAIAVVAAAGIAVAVLAGIRLRRGTSRGARAVRATVSEIRIGLLARRIWPGILISSLVALAGHLTVFLVAARAAGSPAPFVQLLPLMMLALLAMALPVNIGGWGPREGFCAWAFGVAGLGAAQGLTVAVVYGVLAFVGTLPGMAVLAVRALGRPRADRDRADRAPGRDRDPGRDRADGARNGVDHGRSVEPPAHVVPAPATGGPLVTAPATGGR
ncbi:MAG TPA: lysylphosphatidylglycerol synthase domain-containing protein, partial [Pilimelia sp.]|nr:lysylphosphatidylglycerol synthase domain-containing protein [Pilimelia sp.]